MALSANREVDRYVDQELRALPVKGSSVVYKGAFVGLDGGFARPLNAGDDFAGIAYEQCDNGSGSDGDKTVRVFTQGDFEHALTGAARANNGAVLYASDDGTLTTTATDNSAIGRQIDVPSSNKVIVRLKTIFAT